MINAPSVKSKFAVRPVNFRAMLRIPVKFTMAVVDMYALFIVLYLVLRLAGGRNLARVFLLSYLIHLALLPSFVLLPIVLIRRRWLISGFLTINVVAFVVMFGGLFLPKGQTAPEGATVIKAMTFNIASYSQQPDPVMRALRESGADIIALQEVDALHAEIIDRELADLYPYRVMKNNDHRILGKGLISRYPILDYQTFLVYEERVNLDVLIDIDGQPVQVINFHPPPPALYEGAPYIGEHLYAAGEFDAVIERIRVNIPVLILCDCNTTDQGTHYTLLKNAGFTDAFRAAGQGFGRTFPADDGGLGILPALFRIDYVWASDDFIPLNAYVGDGGGSDHFPVIAELALR